MSLDLKSSNLNLWRESFRFSALSLVSSLLTIGVIATLSRGYTVPEVGMYFFLLANVNLITQIFSGLGKALEKRLSERNTGHLQFYSIAVVFLLGVTVSLSIVGYIVSVLLLPYELGDITISSLTVAAIIIGVLGKGGTKTSRSYLAGIGHPTLGQLYKTIFSRAGRLLVVFIIVSVYSGVSIEVAFALSEIIGFIAILVTPFSIDKTIENTVLPSVEEIKNTLVFAKWSIPNSVFNDLYHRLDTFYLAYFLTATTIGYYESSVRLMAIMFAFPYGVSKVLTIKISGLHEEGADYEAIFYDAFKKILLAVAVFLVIVIIFGHELLSFAFGPEYTPAYIYFVGVTIQLLFQSSRIMYETLLNATDNPDKITRITIGTIILNAVIAPPFIIWIGGVGMIISTLVSEAVRVIYFYYIASNQAY